LQHRRWWETIQFTSYRSLQAIAICADYQSLKEQLPTVYPETPRLVGEQPTMTDVAETNMMKVQGGAQSAQEESQEHGSVDKNSVHSRLRANSSIMNLKKIMGESRPNFVSTKLTIAQSQTVERYQSECSVLHTSSVSQETPLSYDRSTNRRQVSAPSPSSVMRTGSPCTGRRPTRPM